MLWGFKMKIIFFLLLVSFPSVVYSKVFVNDHGHIEYHGVITESKNVTAFTLFEKSNAKPKRIVISSSGGAVESGIQLGEWVRENTLDVEVGEYCISSCANYVFIAGKDKFLRRNSFVGWHGSLLQMRQLPFVSASYLKAVDDYSLSCDLSELRARYGSQFEFPVSSNHLRECVLLRELGVDYRVMILGQHSDHYESIKHVGLWSYSYDALKALGVNNIILTDNIWEPPLYVGDQKIFYFDINSLAFFKQKKARFIQSG